MTGRRKVRIPRYVTAILLLALAQPAEAQYRRRAQDLPPLYAVSLSVGALFPYEETVTPTRAPQPEQDLRAERDVDMSPWLVLSARYGRGLGVYASASAARAPDAELSGTDPISGVVLEGTTEVGTLAIFSAGVSFAPLRIAPGLRFEAGPAWVDLGSGGSYLAARLSGGAKFVAIGDGGGMFIVWDGYLAGGQHNRGELEYQLRSGNVTGLRAGFEYAW